MTRTYEALVGFINTEYEKIQAQVTASINAARKEAGPDDSFDVTLGIANKLSFFAWQLGVRMHNASLESSRVHEGPEQLELPFPSN